MRPEPQRPRDEEMLRYPDDAMEAYDDGWRAWARETIGELETRVIDLAGEALEATHLRGELNRETERADGAEYERDEVRAESDALRAELERVRGVLREVQHPRRFEGNRRIRYCPICGGTDPEGDRLIPQVVGHTDNCPLAAALVITQAPTEEGGE